MKLHTRELVCRQVRRTGYTRSAIEKQHLETFTVSKLSGFRSVYDFTTFASCIYNASRAQRKEARLGSYLRYALIDVPSFYSIELFIAP